MNFFSCFSSKSKGNDSNQSKNKKAPIDQKGDYLVPPNKLGINSEMVDDQISNYSSS